MKCKFEHDEDCCNCGSPQYMCKCKPMTCGCAVPMTNADRINSMTIEEKAEFLSKIAYERETPWSKPFAEKFCKSCPEPEYTLEDGSKMRLHECDFSDGVCPHGGDIVWWLKQPAEEDDHA